MGLAQPAAAAMTAAEYLAWEPAQVEKYEFHHGEVFAMGGASRRHVTVSLNLASTLNELLPAACRVYMADMKLELAADATYVYPDVMVSCRAEDHQATDRLRYPSLIIEVISPSTAAYDRGDKAAAYRRLTSLDELVLVDPDRRLIEHYRRTADDLWALQDIQPEQPLILSPAGQSLEIPWARIFRNAD